MTGTFKDAFRRKLEKIEADAREAGINYTVICREAGVSRATPDRWKRKTPKTIDLMDRMQEIVDRHRAAAQSRAA